jgi:hydroxymethylpyrimidine/phosphomethylpyrimidine kinase
VPMTDVSPPTALTIAGSDSGGAAGLQADLRTFLTCGVHGLVAVTAVTVQNTLGVHDRTDLPARIVAGQIEAVAADMGVGAAKTGMLASAEIIAAVAQACDQAGIGRDGEVPFVVDPVAASMHGHPLFDEDGLAALREPLCSRRTSTRSGCSPASRSPAANSCGKPRSPCMRSAPATCW